MKNSTKIEKLKQYLGENYIAYRVRKEVFRGHSDIFLYKVRLAIKIEGEDREEFIETHKGHCGWIFVNDDKGLKELKDEVADRVLKIMMYRTKKIEGRKEHEENMKRHEEKVRRREEQDRMRLAQQRK